MSARIGARAVHLCIDMQRMFAEATEWHTPTLGDIIPNVVRIARAKTARTLFARFTVPETADAARGAWRSYYRRWTGLTGERMEPGLVDLVGPLAPLAAPERVVDKPTYSMFGPSDDLEARLDALGADSLVFTGVETDVCVLATVFDAVDRGYPVTVVADAVTSSSPEAHAAVMRTLLPRMPDQVRIVGTETLLREWAD